MPAIVVADGSPFPAHCLPYGIGSPSSADPRPLVAIGDRAVDLRRLEGDGVFAGTGLASGSFDTRSLNAFAGQGRSVWSAVRARLRELVTGSTALSSEVLFDRSDLIMQVPVDVGDYVDFYSCEHHAANLGRLFRPDSDPLLDNWKRLPVGYHGRSGTIVADGAEIPRPSGLRLVEGEPTFGPSLALDIELEVGFVIGVGNERGQSIATADAADHIFGMCLVNDWSARDIQAYEYVPLGPFLGKSFATSMSPWIVPLEALEPFRMPSPAQDPVVAGYLQTHGDWGFDLHLEVFLQTEEMRASGLEPAQISATVFDMYWTPPQQLAHLTVNGATTRAGDLFASGTVSGPSPGTEGSLIERTKGGSQPITLAGGTVRSYLEDGDRVTLQGWAGSGPDRIGLGSVSGTIVAGSAAFTPTAAEMTEGETNAVLPTGR
jgi:fumarylacetoacetase